MRVFVTVIWFIIAASAHAQTPPYDWRPINHETAAILRAGNYELAASYVEAALASCSQAVNPQEAALCTSIFSENHARVLEWRGDLAGAEVDFKTCIEARKTVLPPLHPLIGQAYYWLALFCQRHDRHVDEVTALLAAETIARAGGPEHQSEVIGLTARRAQALTALERYRDALPLYQDVYATSRDQCGPASVTALIALNNLFGATINAGFVDAAIVSAETALTSPEVEATHAELITIMAER